MSRYASQKDIQLSTFDPIDKARIIVVGDTGVGKTSLVHYICHGTPLRSAPRTVGCSVDVKIHDHPPTSRSYFIEFIDISGTCKQPSSRSIFYHNINGIILVHDLTNKKSLGNLWKWVEEVFDNLSNDRGRNLSSHSNSYSDFDVDVRVDVRVGESRPNIPILVVGTKADLASPDAYHRRRSSIAEEYGAECISMSTHSSLQNPQPQIDTFLNTVIESKLSSPQTHHPSIPTASTSWISPDMQRRRIPQTGLYGGRPTSPIRGGNSNSFGSAGNLWRSKSVGDNSVRGRGMR